MEWFFVLTWDDMMGGQRNIEAMSWLPKGLAIPKRVGQEIHNSHITNINRGTPGYHEMDIDLEERTETGWMNPDSESRHRKVRIGSYFPGRAGREELITFNIILKDGFEGEHYTSFMKKWSHSIIDALQRGGTVDITSIIDDAKNRTRPASKAHELVRALASEATWAELAEPVVTRKGAWKLGGTPVPVRGELAAAGFPLRDPAPFERVVNDACLATLTDPGSNLPPGVRKVLKDKILGIIQSFQERASKPRSIAETALHAADGSAHSVFEPLHDTIAFKVFAILNKKDTGILSYPDLERSFDYDTESLMDRVRLLEEHGLVVSGRAAHVKAASTWDGETYICAPFRIVAAKDMPVEWHVMPAPARGRETARIDAAREVQILGRFFGSKNIASP